MPKNPKKTKTKKKSRERKQKPSFLKRVVTYLFLALTSVFLIALFSYYFVLPSVFSSVKEAKNILIVSDNLDEQNSHISLAHLSPSYDDNLIVFINGDEVVDVGGGYGNYSLNTIYKLLEIDNKSDQKVRSVFSNILNISIDEVVVANGIYENDLENKKLKKIFASNFMRKISGPISNNISLLKLHFLTSSMEIFKLDGVSDVEDIYYKLSTLNEETYQNCSVSVVNTTSENGLAKKISEIIENTGAQVMQVEGSDSMIEKTTIYYPANTLECGQLVDRILGIFPAEVILKSSNELPSTQKFRTNVVVMIGENY